MNSTLLLGVALALGAPALKDSPKKNAGIVGEWIVQSQKSGGRVLRTSVERHYIFTADGKWSIRTTRPAKNGRTVSRTFTIDAKNKPAAIDMKSSATLAQPNMLGIVKVDGDKLTLCYSRDGEDRPTAFESPENTTIVLIVMKRVKKD